MKQTNETERKENRWVFLLIFQEGIPGVGKFFGIVHTGQDPKTSKMTPKPQKRSKNTLNLFLYNLMTKAVNAC